MEPTLTTAPDVARYLAERTILPLLLDAAGPGVPFDVDDSITVNRDLRTAAFDWLARCDAGPRERFAGRLRARDSSQIESFRIAFRRDLKRTLASI